MTRGDAEFQNDGERRQSSTEPVEMRERVQKDHRLTLVKMRWSAMPAERRR
jgi:hypothetical protein